MLGPFETVISANLGGFFCFFILGFFLLLHFLPQINFMLEIRVFLWVWATGEEHVLEIDALN